MTPQELEKSNKEILRQAELRELEPITYEELERVFNKWMLIPDPLLLRFLVAFIFAHRLPFKAVWAIVIGPSGGGKTEFLNALLKLPEIFPISNLTSNTFLSGMPGPNDASLLPKLSDKIMLLKDWTTMISKQKEEKADIFSQLREIYDGFYKKVFGNGKIRIWEGRTSLLAASTQAVDLNQQQYTHLGERFLNYRMIMPDRKAVAMRSLENNQNHEQMEIELQNAVFAYFKGFDDKELWTKDNVPQMTMDLKEKLVSLANFSTMARSGVIRDFGLKKEVIFVPATEMPTRFTQQLMSIAFGCMMANGGTLTDNDMKMLYKVALDSIPQTNKMVINEMAKADGRTTANIATSLGYPTEPIKTYLENLAMLGVCKRIKAKPADLWEMKKEFADIIRKYENITIMTKEEIVQEVMDEEEEVTEDELEELFREN